MYFAAVTLEDGEVITGTQTTLSCVIEGIAHAVSVKWKQGTEEMTTGNGIVVDSGTFANNTQTATLELSSADADVEYTCQVTSGQYSDSDTSSSTITLYLYSK